MTIGKWTTGLGSLFAVGALLVAGCAKPTEKAPQAKERDKAAPVAVAESTKETKDQWWCAEHGIPEAECSMCSDKVAAEFKKKGDWCDKHDRAKSQCFICDPSLKEKFAALYRAKYGKEPPPIEEKIDDKKNEKKEEKK